MRAVSNTSPLSNLAIIGRLELLRQRYGTISIPPAVARELSALTHAAAGDCLKRAMEDGWLIVETTALPVVGAGSMLDPGETEAIALASVTRADVLLMDEKKGREAARRAGLAVAGVLGELLHAKQTGAISSLRAEITRLRAEAGFFVDSEIEEFIVSQAGE